jgi:hypothetical protein
VKKVLWMVLDRGEASVCMRHPGYDSDLVVTTPTSCLSEVFGGTTTWAAAVGSGAIQVEGRPALVRALPRWFLWSPFAPLTEARARRAAAAS